MIGPWTIVFWCACLVVWAMCAPVWVESFLNGLWRKQRAPAVVQTFEIGAEMAALAELQRAFTQSFVDTMAIPAPYLTGGLESDADFRVRILRAIDNPSLDMEWVIREIQVASAEVLDRVGHRYGLQRGGVQGSTLADRAALFSQLRDHRGSFVVVNPDPLSQVVPDSLFIMQSYQMTGFNAGLEIVFQEIMLHGDPYRGPLIVRIRTEEHPANIYTAHVEPITGATLREIMGRALCWNVEATPAPASMGFNGGVWINLGADRRNTEADQKSIALLKEWLSPEQREQYESQKTFEVVGGDTGTRYRIRPPGAYNISVLDSNGGTASNICVVPKDMTALGDILLAQKVALERNERATLKVANRKPEFVGIDRSFANMSMVSGVIQNRQLF